MKFYTIVLLATLFMVGTATAQQPHLGLKAGLNFYDANASGNAGFGKIGFHAGMLAHFHLSKKFAFQPEVMYSGQGAKFSNSNAILNLHYVNVPLQLQYMFNHGFRIQAGPQLGFLVKANSSENILNANNTDDFNALDIALSLGASYVHTSSGFGIDLRYNHGFSQINKVGPEKWSNRGIQLGLFYVLGHKQ